MKLPRRRFLHLAVGAAALPFGPHGARAQAYPSRPVRLMVGYPAGGSADLSARLIGQWLSERLGQQFVIENRPGAANNLATEVVVRAPVDGYTLLLVTVSNTINATLYDKLNFDFIRDIAPISGILSYPNVLEVNTALPVKSVPELIAYAKAHPGELSFASAGSGTTQHMSGEMFKVMAGVNMLHVPYRGNAPALTDLIGGQVQVMFDNMPTSIEHIRAGKLRPLAVTSTERAEVLPNVPTVAEFVPGYEATGWFGIGAPSGTPAEIVEKLNREINAGLADPKFKARLADLGGAGLAGSSADFRKHIAEETQRWGKVVKFANLKPE